MPSRSSNSNKSSASASGSRSRTSVAGRLCVKTLDSGGCAQQPGDGVEGNLAGVRLAEGGEHLNTTGGYLRSNLAHETALPDAR